MIFRRFSFLVGLRIFFIMGNLLLIAVIFGDPRLFFNQIILGIILVLQVLDLIRFVNKTNRELSKFLLAIKQSDYSINFKGTKSGSSFKELYDAFDQIISTYKEVKIEREAQYQFLLILVEHINIGIISISGKDDITLLNKPAKKILGLSDVRTWKAIEAKNPNFSKEVMNLQDEGRKLIEVIHDGEKRTLSLDVSSMKLIGKDNKLITFQDIKSEIEQKEIEAWHKLIRILTHEIMNSITPISSLTETMQMVMQKDDGQPKNSQEIDDESLSDLLFSLKTIQKRSEGMLEFVDDYRKLTRVPKPNPEIVKVEELFKSVGMLMEAELKKEGISMKITTKPEELEIEMDQTLIEQILINLITNSRHALEKTASPSISLSAYERDGRKVVEVADNGSGIKPNELEEIFVPFFSTKDHGSGIGLSLSKQIMNQHHGNIRVNSTVGKGTTFFLEFRV